MKRIIGLCLALVLFWITAVNEAVASDDQSWEVIRLTSPGGSMEGIARRNQMHTGMCYAESTAVAYDAWRKSNGEWIDGSTSSAVMNAISFKVDMKLVDEGMDGAKFVRDVIKAIHDHGSCSKENLLKFWGVGQVSEETVASVLNAFVLDIASARGTFESEFNAIVNHIDAPVYQEYHGLSAFQHLNLEAQTESNIQLSKYHHFEQLKELGMTYALRLDSLFKKERMNFRPADHENYLQEIALSLARKDFEGLYRSFFPQCGLKSMVKTTHFFQLDTWNYHFNSNRFDQQLEYYFAGGISSQPVLIGIDVSVIEYGKRYSIDPNYLNATHSVLVIGMMKNKRTGKSKFLIRDSRRPEVILDKQYHSLDLPYDSEDPLDYWIDGEVLEKATFEMMQIRPYTSKEWKEIRS